MSINYNRKICHEALKEFINYVPKIPEGLIRDRELLIKSLHDLDMMIGHNRLKTDIPRQLKKILIGKRLKIENNDLMSIVLYGPPGVGKTEIGKILAKILMAVGILQVRSNIPIRAAPMPTYTTQSSMTGSGFTDSIVSIIIYISIFVMLINTIFDLPRAYRTSTQHLGKIWGSLFFILIACIFLYFIWPTGSKSRDELRPVESKNNSTVSIDSYFTVLSGSDFIAGYLGQSEIQTRNILAENKGKVIFIDEAYSLDSGPDGRDTYRARVLEIIIKFMSENPDTIFIFAGYKHALKNTIFKSQEGLLRRFLMRLECEPYTAEELYQIFLYQLSRNGWKCKNSKAKRRAKKLIKKNYKYFVSNGGDTARYFTFCKEYHCDRKFINLLANENPKDSTLKLSRKDLVAGMEQFMANYQPPEPPAEKSLFSGLLNR